jgi:hypothetical protein
LISSDEEDPCALDDVPLTQSTQSSQVIDLCDETDASDDQKNSSQPDLHAVNFKCSFFHLSDEETSHFQLPSSSDDEIIQKRAHAAADLTCSQLAVKEYEKEFKEASRKRRNAEKVMMMV